MHNMLSLPTWALTLLASALLSACLQPADEILKSSHKATSLVFVKETSIDNNRSNAMRSNVDEFYPGTDICLLTPISPNGKVENLTAAYTRGGSSNTRDWGAAADPEISFDGKRLLFSMRKAGSRRWSIYEMDLETRNLVQLTDPTVGDDIDPAYLTDDRIVFSSTRAQIVDEYERRQVPQLHVADRKPDGTMGEPRRISTNQSHDNNPFLHSSGKILFSRWDHLGNPNKIPLFSINQDGTGQFVAYGADGPRASGSRTFLEARELADGGIVSSLMERNSPFEGGAIVIIDLSRFTEDPVFITPNDVPFNNTRDTANAIFKTPHPIQDGGKERILVAMSPHAVGRDMSSGVDYGLYVMDKDGKNLTLVYNDASTNDHSPIPVAPRRLPALTQNSNEVAQAIAQNKTTGMFFDANVYSRMDNDGHMKPNPDFINADGSKGEVKYVRVMEAIPLPVDRNKRGGNLGRTNFEKQRVIGYADVREDGSFSIEVPAKTALHLQTLNESGLMLVNQLQWIQVMPGERRLCTGCHGPRDRDRDIERIAILDDNRVGWRIDMATEVSLANIKAYISGFHNAQSVTAHGSVRLDTVDFFDFKQPTRPNTLQAVLDARCISCHGSGTAASAGGGLVLQEVRSDSLYEREGISTVYNRLTRDSGYKLADNKTLPYATQNGARRSPLMWVLFNKQLNGATSDYRKTSHDHSTHWEKDGHGVINPFLPANADLLLLIEWLDMGVQFSNSVNMAAQ